jgi:phosphatidate phosphatase APP1
MATARTDREGFFTIELPAGEEAFPTGRHPVRVRARISGEASAETRAQAQIYPASLDRVVVCDFDDTLVKSHMKHALRAAWKAMTGDPARLDPVEGMKELLEGLAGGRESGAAVAYLSGSPVNFHPRIKAYLEQNDFPRGPLLLRNLGLGPDNESWSLTRYKTLELRRLMEIFPDTRFVLVGDSGQSDPEIYRALKKETPERIEGILIRRLEGDDEEKRFEGIITFEDGEEGLEKAREAGLIREGEPRPAGRASGAEEDRP